MLRERSRRTRHPTWLHGCSESDDTASTDLPLRQPHRYSICVKRVKMVRGPTRYHPRERYVPLQNETHETDPQPVRRHSGGHVATTPEPATLPDHAGNTPPDALLVRLWRRQWRQFRRHRRQRRQQRRRQHRRRHGPATIRKAPPLLPDVGGRANAPSRRQPGRLSESRARHDRSRSAHRADRHATGDGVPRSRPPDWTAPA